ncbi:MAG: RecQ family ATP-dependent DNA helicase [Bacteroidota bacterium]
MEDYRQILTRFWGYSAFRPVQEEIVVSAGSGRDTLALLPTGGGKSVTFQVPALAKEGICLVVTPLIALMKDQVENLQKRGIRALLIHSGMSREEIAVTLDNAIFGDFKFLYLSPERIATDLFRAKVVEMNVNLIAVDEAHCISQWGYDFRPAYLEIAALRELLPGVPVLALTATATPEVAEDIMERLAFRDKNLIRKSFERKNLVYVVRKTEDKVGEMLRIAERIAGTGVVYVRSRRKCRELADQLVQNGHTAGYYHAGLSFDERNRMQEDWRKDRIRIMVSTNAFGMGIDKPDVRFVIHIDLPDNPESYFQEAGRAGRDEKKAWAILLYSPSDERIINQRIEVSFPGIARVKEVYHALGSFLQVPYGTGKGMSYDFILPDFLRIYKFNAMVAHSSLDVLVREGYIEVSDEINNPSRVHFIVSRDDLYKFQVKNAAFDSFIKLLLRSYSGMFSQYVAIDEQVLARRSGLTFDAIYKYLLSLSNQQIINYIPRKKNPVVTYLEERLPEASLHISPENYQLRKERFIRRQNEMLRYAQSENRCRSQFLLAYFGEKEVARCGQCDVCLQRNELGLSEYEFDLVVAAVKKILARERMTLRQLVEETGIPGEKSIRVIEWLIDHHKLVRGEDLKLEWKH